MNHRPSLYFAVPLALLAAAIPAPASNPFAITAEFDQDPPDRKSLAIDELIAINADLSIANHELAAENARLNLELSRLKAQVEELSTFIEDHDEYGSDFEQYTFFREQREREARARAAAEARQRKEEERQRTLEQRNNRRNRNDPADADDDVLAKRVDMLKRAGFTRIGDHVFVGEMGYSYKTDEREVIRYSPYIEHWYTDRTEVIDYKELSVSGSIIHAASDERNISIALAFYDGNGAQLGSTNVQVQAARPGVPYPFTATVKMTANMPFKRYSSWVLYDDPVQPPPMGENELQPAPHQPPTSNQPGG